MSVPAFVIAAVRRFLRPAFRLFLLLALLAPCMRAGAAGEEDTFWNIYDPKPHHAWNRVFRVLYEEGENWPDSVLRGQRYKDVTAALDHFLNTRAERLIDDPLARALFQNDLWKFFNWTLPHVGTWDDQPAVLTLQQKVVRIMRRVALAPAEIKNLPDTFAAAVRTGVHPAAYDPAHREKPFLPPDLWDENGSWVLLGNNPEQKPAAVLHAQQLGGASDFFVLLSLPGGRDETIQVLEHLHALDYLWDEQQIKLLKRQGAKFLPELPPYDEQKLETWLESLPPIGSRVALVRQMRLLDKRGNDSSTRVIETVQVRVYRDPKLPRQFPAVSDDTRFNPTTPLPSQDVYMLRLDRQALTTGAANTLRPVNVSEYTRYVNFINGRPPPGEVRPPHALPALTSHATRVVDSCALCHGPGGLFSFMTFSRGFGTGDTLPKLHAHKREHEEGQGRRLQQYRLGYLRALWDTVDD